MKWYGYFCDYCSSTVLWQITETVTLNLETTTVNSSLPYNGTYTFTVSLRNQDQFLWLNVDIRQIWEGGFKNLCRVKSNDLNSNQERQMAGCTAVAKLTAGDVVAVVNNDNQDGYYRAGYTMLSGNLLKRDIWVFCFLPVQFVNFLFRTIIGMNYVQSFNIEIDTRTKQSKNQY